MLNCRLNTNGLVVLYVESNQRVEFFAKTVRYLTEYD